MKKCISCGREVPSDSVFCPFCGSKNLENENTCPNCNRVIPADSVFCPFCGEKTTGENKTEPVPVKIETPETKERANKTENVNSDPGFFKRILSWIVLFLCYVVAFVIFEVSYIVAGYLARLISDLPSVLKVIAYIFGGGTVLFGVVFIPYSLGLPLIIGASEKVCPSKNGFRYLLFGGFLAIIYIYAFIDNLLNHHISLFYLALGLFGIGIMYFGKTTTKKS